MKRNANTATATAAKANTAETTTRKHDSATERGKERTMSTRKSTVTVTVIDKGWKFTPASIALHGHVFDADKYAIAEKGDVYVLAKVEGVALRLHVGKDSPVYHEALETAVAYNAMAAETKAAETKPAPVAQEAKPAPAKKPAKAKATKAAETKPAPVAQEAKPAPAEKPAKAKAAKAAETKPAPVAQEAKPAPAKKPAETKAAAPAMPADNAWIGTTIEGKGWRIAFDEAAQRTRVILDADPSAKQRAAIDAAGFYWSNATKSWNKKLTRKAYRAAMALAETMNALA